MAKTNSYKSVQSALTTWNGKNWKFERQYFNRKNDAAICKEDGVFFIITHSSCVNYRLKLKQVVKQLN